MKAPTLSGIASRTAYHTVCWGYCTNCGWPGGHRGHRGTAAVRKAVRRHVAATGHVARVITQSARDYYIAGADDGD